MTIAPNCSCRTKLTPTTSKAHLMADRVRHHRADFMGELSNWIPACAGMTCACGAPNCYCRTNLVPVVHILAPNCSCKTNLIPTTSKAHLMAGEVRHHRADFMGELSNWIPACAGMTCACGAPNCYCRTNLVPVVHILAPNCSCKTNLIPTTSKAHLMAGEVRHHRADIGGVTEP